MRINSPPFRRRPLSLTSLIDVIFLLLLFFMLSSTFTRFARVEISGGEGGAGSASETPDVLIRLDGERWTVNGSGMGRADAMTELHRLEAAGARSVVVLVRSTTTSQALVGAIETVRAETGLSVSVAR